VFAEFESLNLGDRRLDRRGRAVLERLEAQPSASLPQAMASSAELEGAYRLLNNPRVTMAALLEPHLEASWNRVSEASSWILSVEDTTEMRFGGDKDRQGLGALTNDGHGFFLHAALLVAVDDEGRHTPAGLGALEVLVRDPERPKVHWKKRIKDPERESLRWHRVSEAIGQRAAGKDVRVIHVGDREVDDYAWLESVMGSPQRQGLVIRSSHNRRVGLRTGNQESQEYLWDVVTQSTPVLATRNVGFQSRTTSGGRRRRDPRAGRQTQLEVRAAPVELIRPHLTTAKVKTLNLNVVVVVESDPPEGEEAIQWTLLTTEPVDTSAAVLKVVDAYRARWLVEEFFKALKTGCKFESRQLESLHGLQNMLALCIPIASRMLALRGMARDRPDTVLTDELPAQHLACLQIINNDPKNRWGVKLAETLTAGSVLAAVARMGGHLKHNGPPGWLTIYRGYRTLHDMVAMMQMMQS
jgi:hypothetical protein